MLFHSIRWRLQLWHGLILVVVLSGFGVAAYRLHCANELRRVDQELQQRIGPVLEALRRPMQGPRGGPGGPGRPDGPPPRGELDEPGRRGPPLREFEDGPPFPRELRIGPNRAWLFEGETNAFYYTAWLRDGRELGRSASAPADVPLPERIPGEGRSPVMRTRGLLRELYQFTPPGDCIVVGRSVAPERAGFRQLALWLTGLGGAVLFLGLGGGWWVATRAIRPIHHISSTAAKIANGDLSQRINAEKTDDELGQLAAVLNATFARLEASFERQRQFTADASHELRTPVSVILSQTQATLARERTSAEYRESLEACQRAAQRMRALTESLLILARIDAGQGPLRREPADLAVIARDCLELLQPLAGERHVTIQRTLATGECVGDQAQLAQVVTNLVANAILHNRSGGEVRVETRAEGGAVVLVVADNGPGIPPGDLPRLFERFHRADQSRTSATGGTGLGLAISKAIVEAHGGTIEVVSETGNGATFTVRLPAQG